MLINPFLHRREQAAQRLVELTSGTVDGTAVARETSAPGVLRAAATAWADRPALEIPSRRWNYAQLWADVVDAARHRAGHFIGENEVGCRNAE